MTDNNAKTKVQAGASTRRSSEDAFSPLVDIYEAEDGTTILLAEVPGATNESLDVRVDKGVLTIQADAGVPEPGEGYSRTYTGFVGGEYFRAFALSDEIDRDKIEANLTDGLLTLRLPRAAAAETRKIPIK